MEYPLGQAGNPIPIMIKVWAGAAHDLRYLRRSLPSLLDSGLPEAAQVILIDDCSPDARVKGLLQSCRQRGRVEVWTNAEHLGPNRGQEVNFPRVVQKFPEAPYYLLCDDDVIYHPGWLQRLIQVYEEAKATGLQGVFTALNVPVRPSYRTLRLPTSEVLLKERQAALNWLLPREVYEMVGPFRDTGVAYDTDYCNRLTALKLPVICLKPSYVQNIGYHGAYQFDESYTASDYVGKVDWYLRSRDLWYRIKRKSWNLARQVRNGVLRKGMK